MYMTERGKKTNTDPQKQGSQPGIQTPNPGTIRIELPSRLDIHATTKLWKKVHNTINKVKPREVSVDAGHLEYCDTAGLSLLFDLEIRSQKEDYEYRISGLNEKFQNMLSRFDTDKFMDRKIQTRKNVNIAQQVGEASVNVWRDIYTVVEFLGETFVKVLAALIKPWDTRWKETFIVSERTGVNAVGIMTLVGVLFGLILAYTGVITLEKFGAEIYVANMAAISIVRVLGPFITAVILSGRSGSAFAAEIGTMKINEELDALYTMNIDPMRFLVVPRVLATTVMTPLLAVITNIAGLFGAGIVLLSLGIPVVTYTERVRSALDFSDVYSGLFKAMVFGTIIATVGCLRGMETKTGASAVGDAATQAVVTSIVLIIAAEGVFQVLFYHLGI